MLDLHPATAGAASARFTLHYLEDTAVLFDAAAQRLYELNATAAYIWTYLEQRVPASVIVGNLCATFGFPREAAETHVRSVLASRQRLSVVAAPLAGAEPARTAAAAPVRGPWQSALTLRLLDQTVHLRCGPSMPGGELARAFSLLRTDAGNGDAIAFDLTCRGDRFQLRVDGAVTDRCWRADQVLPMVKARMVEVVLARSGDLFAVHAAAVGRGRSCVLIPGPSGSGKSTLAAALSADGFRLLGDDTVVLARESLAARPMALPICLKDGSWRLLAPRYPELEFLGINVRGDGKRARYLLPPKRDRARSRRVTAIVFPCRTASLEGGLVPLAKPEALTRLMGGLCPLGAELDARTVERFVRWIEEIDCRELRYGTLDEGVDRIGELCR
ncbi:MAG: PqqD family peptide modification chaperone [Alphaproteobacteria bacterium]|nr:PqqD family peptide modification chaperone [Alphaproteobacteria bacterium]